MTLKEELIQEWVEALESGDYKQGTGRLCLGGQYCCLGVVSELAVAKDIISSKRVASEVQFDETTNLLPRKLQILLGLNATAEYSYKDEEGIAHITALTEDNDIMCKSFDQIADTIKRGFDPNDHSIIFLQSAY